MLGIFCLYPKRRSQVSLLTWPPFLPIPTRKTNITKQKKMKDLRAKRVRTQNPAFAGGQSVSRNKRKKQRTHLLPQWCRRCLPRQRCRLDPTSTHSLAETRGQPRTSERSGYSPSTPNSAAPTPFCPGLGKALGMCSNPAEVERFKAAGAAESGPRQSQTRVQRQQLRKTSPWCC